MTRVLYWLAALALSAFVALYVDTSHHDQPIALCPNHDTVRVHPTPWERERGRTVRTVPITCEAIPDAPEETA